MYVCRYNILLTTLAAVIYLKKLNIITTLHYTEQYIKHNVWYIHPTHTCTIHTATYITHYLKAISHQVLCTRTYVLTHFLSWVISCCPISRESILAKQRSTSSWFLGNAGEPLMQKVNNSLSQNTITVLLFLHAYRKNSLLCCWWQKYTSPNFKGNYLPL